MRLRFAWPLVVGALVVGVFSGRLPAQTFVARQDPADLRMLTYNVYLDHIFPDESAQDADKFERIVNAVEPDIINVQEIYNHNAGQLISLLNTIAPLGGGQSWHAFQGSDNVIASKYPLSLTRTVPVPAGDRDLAMALVDLPDAQFHRDVYIMNNHYKCCGGFDNLRQKQSDALVNWMRDARTVGGGIDLPGLTPMMVLGDLNIVDSQAPLDNLINGHIVNQSTYGPDSPPDWNASPLLDARPRHNATGVDEYTWRNDSSSFPPGVLDHVVLTDSVAELTHAYVLNTVAMSAADRTATGLQTFDVVLNPSNGNYDHLPLVTDFRWVPLAVLADLDGDGALGAEDLDNLQNQLAAGTADLRFDFSGDALLNASDIATWLFDIRQTLPGDANLDGTVDGADFVVWNQFKFQSRGLWTQGDFNFDGQVDGEDFLVWNDYKFQSAGGAVSVPEPAAILLIGLAALVAKRTWCR